MRDKIVAWDRKLGRVWAKLGGSLFLLIGIGALVSLITTEGFGIATHWPGLAIASLFFVAAWFCFRSRLGLVDTISDNHPESRN